MGNVASELVECKACSCSCEDALAASKYGDINVGGPEPPAYPWQDESYRYAGSSPPPTAPADRARGSRSRLEQQAPAPLQSMSPAASPRLLPSTPYAGSPPSPSSVSSPSGGSPMKQRQSWQDLDGEGNYHLHFDIKQSDRFGLQLVETRSGPVAELVAGTSLLVVSHIEPLGSVAFSSKRSPGLFPGDIIMKANRRRGAASMLRDIINQVAANGGELFLVVQPRPAAFDVCMKREGPNWKKLGLSVAIDKEDAFPRMRVRVVRNEGLIPKWNETNGSMRICVGDYITQVNGITQSATEMYKLIETSSEGQMLELRIETPSRDMPRQVLEIASPRLGNSSPESSPQHRMMTPHSFNGQPAS